MDSRPGWMEGTDDPAIAVIASNNVSRIARRANQITEEVNKIKQRVDRMIQTFERTHNSVLSSKQSPDMEILEDMDELENVLHDQDQKRRYQQKLTVFIVGYQETCGQRRHLLTQLQEFFSIYSNIGGEEGDHQLGQPNLDLDGIAYQVTGAVKSAQAAMSRLADIHTGIMSYVSQTLSAGSQGKWKSSQDRGRKKLEKVLEQTRLDIVQLTDQLLQAKEDLSLKDQQMKELQKQNELRMLEIQHFKSQLQATKSSLQSLQDETATQRSLLEAELRSQAGKLEELGSRAAVRVEQLANASTQWEVLESMCEDGEKDITAFSEGEQNVLEDSMEITEKTSIIELIDEQSDAQNFELEFSTIDTGTETAPRPQSVDCIVPVYEENSSEITGFPAAGEYDTIITSASVISSSLLPPENSERSVTPPSDISALQLRAVSEMEIHRADYDQSEVHPPTSSATPSEERMTLLLTPSISQDNMMSPEDKLSQLILPHVTEGKDQSEQSVSGEIPESNLSPSGESNVTPSCHEPDKETHPVSSTPMSEKFPIPITSSHLTHEGVPCPQPDRSDSVFQVSENNNSNITLLINDEDNPMTSVHITNKDTHLIISPSNIKEKLDFPSVSKIRLPADNMLEAMSPSFDHNDLTAPISDHIVQYSPSIPVPDMATLRLTSRPVLDETTELITSLSVPSDSMHLWTARPLKSENSNMDSSIITSFRGHMKHKLLQNKMKTLSSPVALLLQANQRRQLCSAKTRQEESPTAQPTQEPPSKTHSSPHRSRPQPQHSLHRSHHSPTAPRTLAAHSPTATCTLAVRSPSTATQEPPPQPHSSPYISHLQPQHSLHRSSRHSPTAPRAEATRSPSTAYSTDQVVITHLEDGSDVKSLSSDHHAQLWLVTQRLHRCVQEIRDLLITEVGFQSLADGLTQGIRDNNGDGISENLTQLENFLAVLHGLLHTAKRKSPEHTQLSDDRLQDVDVTHGNKMTGKNSPLLVIYTETGTQTYDDLSINSPISYDSGSTHSLIFTRLDEEHNRRVLQRARYQGRIPIHLYQDASKVMSAYRLMRQERLRVLVWGYVLYIAWKRAESLLQKQCLLRPQVTPTLSKLQKLKDQVFLRWRQKMMQSQEERMALSAAVHKTLQGVQEESGIFLIKPVLSWSASSSVMETRKQSRLRCKVLLQPALPSLDQDGLLCYGRAASHVFKQRKTMHTHTEVRPLVITPKLQEMDVHRYLCKECCVMSKLQDSSPGSPLKSSSLQRNLVSVTRTPPFPAL